MVDFLPEIEVVGDGDVMFGVFVDFGDEGEEVEFEFLGEGDDEGEGGGVGGLEDLGEGGLKEGGELLDEETFGGVLDVVDDSEYLDDLLGIELINVLCGCFT